MTQVKYQFKATSNRTSQLIAATEKGDLSEIQTLTPSFADLDTRNKAGLSITMLTQEQAILDYFYKIAERYFMSENQIDFKKQDPKNRNLLHWAAKCNQNKTVFQKLISAGGDINSADNPFAVTPLYITAQEGHLDAAEALLTLGANQQAAINGATPLHAACQIGNNELVKQLIQAGAALNQQCLQGGTPLFSAAQHNRVEVARTLLDHGADVHLACQDGATPLYVAAQNGHVEFVKLLLNANANPKQACQNDHTPIDAARYHNHTEIIELLSEAEQT